MTRQAIENGIVVARLGAMLCLAAFAAGQGRAAILYHNDFDDAGLPNATAHFTHGAGALNYEATAAGAVITSTAATQVIGVGDPGFVVSTRFTVNATGANTSQNSSIGFGLFGTNAAFSGNAANPYYLADFIVNGPAGEANNVLGQMRIIALGDTSDFVGSGNFAGPAVAAGETYELRLTGSYSSGTLTMTLQMYDDLGNPLGVSGTAADASPLTGEFFGYRNRLVPQSGLTSISYDYFSVAKIPEPSTLALAVVSSVWLASRLGGAKRQNPFQT